MGSPQPPTPAQRTTLLDAAKLQTLTVPERVAVTQRRMVTTFSLSRQGVSLLRLVW